MMRNSIDSRNEYAKDLDYLNYFLSFFGFNYKFATHFFPRKIREQTRIFYSFVRYADELVDNPEKKMPGQTHDSIHEYISEWKNIIGHGPESISHPILRATYFVFKDKNIPFDYSLDFLNAMNQDTYQERYERYRELEGYMWGSASVVGHIMTFILGYHDARAFDDARALGEAMQLANILRDVDEDYTERNRIYLPIHDMTVFGVTEDMIKNRKVTPELYNLLKFYHTKTENLFAQGIGGIHHLKQGKFPVLLASRMYRENVRILKKRGYNIFAPRIRISRMKKIWILITSIFVYPFLFIRSNRKFVFYQEN